MLCLPCEHGLTLEQVLHIVHSVMATLLFGYLHQGGILPALQRLDALALAHAPLRVISWKSFGVPRSLVDPARGELAVDDPTSPVADQ